MVQGLNGEVREKFPTCILIAEDLQNNDYLTRGVQDGGCGFHAQWDARFVHPVREALITTEDEHRSLSAVAEALLANYNGDPFQSILYTESHDEVANGKQRVPSEITPDNPDAWHARKRSVLGAALVMTAPGTPMIFQGQEFLAQGWFQDSEPLDWDKREDYRGVLRLYHDLIRLRRNQTGQTAGLLGAGLRLIRVDEEAKVLVYQRWKQGGPGDDVVVAINFSHKLRAPFRVGFPASGAWVLRFNSDWNGYGDDFSSLAMEDVVAEEAAWDEMPCSAEISLPAYTALIFSQDAG